MKDRCVCPRLYQSAVYFLSMVDSALIVVELRCVRSIDGSFSVYLHGVLIRLARQSDTELNVDRMYTRQDDAYIVLDVPKRLVPRRLGI